MPKFTREQIRRRRRIAAAILAFVIIVLFAGCTLMIGSLLRPDQPSAHTPQAKAMTIKPTPAGAKAHSQLLKGVQLQQGESLGIDVSSYQGDIDWAKVASDGYTFAYIKATEGKGYRDPKFAKNWKAAQAEGLTVGAYHYFTLCSSGADQAKEFLSTVPVNDAALPPAIDLEFDGACDKRPEAKRAQAEIDTFLREVESAWGRRVMVYSSSEWRRHYGLPHANGRPAWLYSDKARPDDPEWAVWQLHFKGEVSGIKGDVDIDVARAEKVKARSMLSSEARKQLNEQVRKAREGS